MQNIKTKKIRLGFLMHGIFYGGATRSLIFLLDSIKDNPNYEFFIYTNSCKSKEIKKELEKYVIKIRKVHVNLITSNQAAETTLLNFKKILKKDYSKFIKRIKLDQIDILHVNTTVFSHTYKIIKENTNIKILTHIRELLPRQGNSIVGDFIINEINKYSDAIICISNNEADRFQDFLKPKYIIPNPISLSQEINKDLDIKKQYNISENKTIITMSSYLYKPKGHLVFLESLNILIKDYKKTDILFLIVGVKKPALHKVIIKKILGIKDFKKELISFIKKNSLEPYIKLIPYTFEILPIINLSHIIVRPALTADPWGRDIIEAMALKKPVVATGTSEFYVENEVTGFLVKPNNPNELAEKILVLLNNKPLRLEMGENGYNKIMSMCNIDKYKENLLNVYNSVVAN